MPQLPTQTPYKITASNTSMYDLLVNKYIDILGITLEEANGKLTRVCDANKTIKIQNLLGDIVGIDTLFENQLPATENFQLFSNEFLIANSNYGAFLSNEITLDNVSSIKDIYISSLSESYISILIY